MLHVWGAEIQILGLVIGFVIGAVFTSVLGHVRPPKD